MTDPDEAASPPWPPLDALVKAYEAAIVDIRATSDPQQALERTTELVETLRQLTIKSAEVRLENVGRIWEAEKLSLAALARRVGVSKSRADEMIESWKAKKEDRDV